MKRFEARPSGQDVGGDVYDTQQGRTICIVLDWSYAVEIADLLNGRLDPESVTISLIEWEALGAIVDRCQALEHAVIKMFYAWDVRKSNGPDIVKSRAKAVKEARRLYGG